MKSFLFKVFTSPKTIITWFQNVCKHAIYGKFGSELAMIKQPFNEVLLQYRKQKFQRLVWENRILDLMQRDIQIGS